MESVHRNCKLLIYNSWEHRDLKDIRFLKQFGTLCNKALQHGDGGIL